MRQRTGSLYLTYVFLIKCIPYEPTYRQLIPYIRGVDQVYSIWANVQAAYTLHTCSWSSVFHMSQRTGSLDLTYLLLIKCIPYEPTYMQHRPYIRVIDQVYSIWANVHAAYTLHTCSWSSVFQASQRIQASHTLYGITARVHRPYRNARTEFYIILIIYRFLLMWTGHKYMYIYLWCVHIDSRTYNCNPSIQCGCMQPLNTRMAPLLPI